MRKRWYRRILIMTLILVSVLGAGLSIEDLQTEYERRQVSTGNISNQMVIPGGMPIGICIHPYLKLLPLVSHLSLRHFVVFLIQLFPNLIFPLVKQVPF